MGYAIGVALRGTASALVCPPGSHQRYRSAGTAVAVVKEFVNRGAAEFKSRLPAVVPGGVRPVGEELRVGVNAAAWHAAIGAHGRRAVIRIQSAADRSLADCAKEAECQVQCRRIEVVVLGEELFGKAVPSTAELSASWDSETWVYDSETTCTRVGVVVLKPGATPPPTMPAESSDGCCRSSSAR